MGGYQARQSAKPHIWLLDNPAGHPGACRTRRLTFVVIRFGVDNDRRAIGVEYGMLHRRAQRHPIVHDIELVRSAVNNKQIVHVARMRPAFRMLSVWSTSGIEMATRGFERRFAFARPVNMKGVYSWRQPL